MRIKEKKIERGGWQGIGVIRWKWRKEGALCLEKE